TDRHADALVEAAKGLLSDEKSFKKRKVLIDLLQNLEDTSDLESRDEDADWFNGTGSFDQKLCQSLHSINPYGSRESRIVFSTWNLDHRIEKKRTIIPSLLEALQNHKTTDINLIYFYQMLFTRENLKLVHIACHKKGAHNLLCDTRKMFRTGKNAKQDTTVKKKRLI
ncbi:hypothetical protein GOODEAATRI_024809, partial [Goodea atripinnis]